MMTSSLADTLNRRRFELLAALSARFRDIDLAEEALSEACLRAVSQPQPPSDWAAWLYRTAVHAAIDQLRRRQHARRHAEQEQQLRAESADMADSTIPDRRLALIFACGHPAIDATSRAALMLSVVCGLTAAQIATAFLIPASTIAQRLTRAKRKLSGAGIIFEIPGQKFWPERLNAVLSTLEVAYIRSTPGVPASEAGPIHANQIIELADLVSTLLPEESDAHAVSATLNFSEARRRAKADCHGNMVPLDQQAPEDWDQGLIAVARRKLERAERISRTPAAKAPTARHPSPRLIKAQLQRCWCERLSLHAPAPWEAVLQLYDQLVAIEDSPFTRLNRAVALGEVEGAAAALSELNQLSADRMSQFAPYHAVHAAMLAKTGETSQAIAAYDRAITLTEDQTERSFLEKQRSELDR
ncbi:RNA polymerase sigma factor [Altericroceibacterium endophyticum]|uniref:Sigma-70 family RNA polymerase sigma factor n=1 Tax=Altericroceibacterium endophyticum TaxID=1808508 RepID=A0A6I4T3Q0_9SPHN|nr:sigma-70 family RNA polymerase sigma factor [Altericroceibacterium endophyticum]MXO64771.1 sigma-70 family RNA polymerase sigma factor [Altericroceibacterium endophyticum]